MVYQLTLQDVTYQDYPIQYLPAESSMKEMDISEVLDSLFHIWIRQERLKRLFFYQNLLPLLEIDLSSVWPRFEVKSNKTSLMEIEEISEEMIAAEMLIHDFIVRIPPKKKYRVEIEVRSIKRGEPTIVVPEEFL